MRDSTTNNDQDIEDLLDGLSTDDNIGNSRDEADTLTKEKLSISSEIALLIKTFRCNIEKKPKARTVAVTAEEMANERLEWGYELVFDIIKRQKRFMITFSFIFITLLLAQYGYLVYKVETVNVTEISSVIIVQLVMLAIETLGILGIITKFIFSNQTKEIIDGIYKHAHYHKEDSKNESKTTED